MEDTPNISHHPLAHEAGSAKRKPAADYVYQWATIAAALLLLLTATV